MMRQGIAASATEPPYNLATAAKALIDTLYIATRKRRRFASLPEVDMGEVDRAGLAGVCSMGRCDPAPPQRHREALGGVGGQLVIRF